MSYDEIVSSLINQLKTYNLSYGETILLLNEVMEMIKIRVEAIPFDQLEVD